MSHPAAPLKPAGIDSQAQLNGFDSPKAGSIASVLSTFGAPGTNESKIAFLEPRGLVNTGNMCYMNAVIKNLCSPLVSCALSNNEQVLQILLYCVPFYDFLDSVGKRAAHSFKSDTPLVDAM